LKSYFVVFKGGQSGASQLLVRLPW